MKEAPQLVLASTSRIRSEILRKAGVEFSAQAPLADEEAAKRDFDAAGPSQLAARLAAIKALSLASDDRFIIGADQVLALGSTRYSKPRTIADARQQLMRLRGHRHSLMSAVVLARRGKVLWQCLDQAHLVMRDFSDEFLDEYLALEGMSVLSSVGGYKLEGRGIQLFASVEGDHYTILGLPLLPLLEALRSNGAISS